SPHRSYPPLRVACPDGSAIMLRMSLASFGAMVEGERDRFNIPEKSLISTREKFCATTTTHRHLGQSDFRLPASASLYTPHTALPSTLLQIERHQRSPYPL